MITYIDSKNCQKVCRLMRIMELLQGVRDEPAGGRLCFPDREVCGVSIDSRDCREGSVFVCIRGSVCNGSRYANEALDTVRESMWLPKKKETR